VAGTVQLLLGAGFAYYALREHGWLFWMDATVAVLAILLGASYLKPKRPTDAQ
jgi:hypothetical protein